MDLKDKRILITQPMLYSYAGSEVFTVELAEHLKNCGATAEIYTYVLAEPLRSELEKRDIPVYAAEDDPDLDLFQYDLLWIHSQTFPASMVRQLSAASEDWDKAPYFIFLHMSSADFVPTEFPWIYKFEDTLADKILYISEKVESTHRDLLEAEIPFAYFRNPAPVHYFSTKQDEKQNNVLVVSNHVPPEVIQAADILRSEGIRVNFLGREQGTYKFIRPEDIRKYDSVITVGKTVQYCILSGTPVYVYDQFGGPGYLSPENYVASKSWHFSGRGFEKKTAEEIAREIRGNREKAYEEILYLQQNEAEEYRIDTALDRILTDLIKRKKNRISPAQERSIFYAQRLARDRFALSYAQLMADRARKAERERFTAEIRHYKAELDGSREEIAAIARSPSMKAGRLITYLPRKGRDFVKNHLLEIPGRIRRVLHPKKICLVTCVYNEERNLPDYLKHIEPYVDFIVMLDDGSTDDTKKILRDSPKLRALIEKPGKKEIGDWNETENREELLKKAKELGADWILALDPDERFETRFLQNLRDIVESSDDDTVYGLHFRALWNSYDQFRVDGIWGTRTRYCLFPLNRELVYEVERKKLHYRWYPDSLLGHEILLDYEMYHLKSVLSEARVKRAALYNSLDPHKIYQSIGYDFLVDEDGMTLQKILPGHEYDYETVPSYLRNAVSANESDPSRSQL